MYCINCGHEIEPSAKFCSNCGTEVAASGKKGKQPKENKPFYKRWWFWAAVVVLAIAVFGSGGADSQEPAETNATIAATTEAPTTEPTVAETEAAEETAAVNIPIDTALSLIEGVLEDSFEHYELSYEDEMIVVNLWDDGIAAGASLAQSGDQECVESWNKLVDSQIYFANSMVDLMEAMGLSEIPVSVNVLNDINKENVLISTLNGIVIYNVVED